MAWISVAVGAIGAGTAIYSAASQQSPSQPNLTASSQALSNTNAALLPIQRGLQAAQQTGGSYTFTVPQGMDVSQFLPQASQPTAGWYDANGNLVSTDPNAFKVVTRGNHLGQNTTSQNIPAGITWQKPNTPQGGNILTRNADGSFTANFAGYGVGQVQAQAAQQAAASQLALQQKYDPQFIAASLQQEKLADPQSVAAQAQEAKLIQQQQNAPTSNPVADMMNSQVQNTLNAANNNTLTGIDQQRLADATAAALSARGGNSPTADFSAPLTTGFAGEQRQSQAAQNAQNFLTSGSSPQDYAFRLQQQNIANLSAEAAGKTPQSQFSALSGAQYGATPMATQQPLVGMPQTNFAAADQAALQNSATTNYYNSNQVNPWTQGLSSAMTLASTINGLGTPSHPAS